MKIEALNKVDGCEIDKCMHAESKLAELEKLIREVLEQQEI